MRGLGTLLAVRATPAHAASGTTSRQPRGYNQRRRRCRGALLAGSSGGVRAAQPAAGVARESAGSRRAATTNANERWCPDPAPWAHRGETQCPLGQLPVNKQADSREDCWRRAGEGRVWRRAKNAARRCVSRLVQPCARKSWPRCSSTLLGTSQSLTMTRRASELPAACLGGCFFLSCLLPPCPCLLADCLRSAGSQRADVDRPSS